MKKVLIGVICLSLVACNKKQENTRVLDLPAEPAETAAPSAIEAAAGSLMGSAPETYTVPVTQQNPVAATGRINPPHGEPGHSCDFPEGALLPVEQVAQVKINPPHGEPGHSCDYPVGAELPADVVSTASVNTVVEMGPQRPTPIQPSMTSPINMPINKSVNVGPKPQFNPPHGQPWHTCDLEVGAPLS